MDKRTLVIVLSVVAVLCLGYGVYRSLPERVTTVENGIETVYGEPQHGLILGLLLLAGICIWGIVYLATRRAKDVPIHQQHIRTEPPIANTGSTGSSYRPLS